MATTKEPAVQWLHGHLILKTCLCSEEASLQRLQSFADWMKDFSNQDFQPKSSQDDEAIIPEATLRARIPEEGATDKGNLKRSQGTPSNVPTDEFGSCSQDCRDSPTSSALLTLNPEGTEGESAVSGKDFRNSPAHSQKEQEVFQAQAGPEIPRLISAKSQSVTVEPRANDMTEADDLSLVVEGTPLRCDGGEWNLCLAVGRQAALACLTVGRELFAASHCGQLRCLQVEMACRQSLLQELSGFLAAEDRLVAYMACKMTKAVLVSASLEKEKSAEFLQHILQKGCGTIQEFMSIEVNSCCQGDSGQADPGQTKLDQPNPDQTGPRVGQGDASQLHADEQKSVGLTPGGVSPGQLNRAIFTFDLCRLLLKEDAREVGQGPNEEGEGSQENLTCRRDSHPMSQEEHSTRLQDLQEELTHLLYRVLPDILLAFSKSRRPTDSDSDGNTLTSLLASLLDLILSLLRCGEDGRQWVCFVSKLSSPLLRLLRVMPGDPIIFKKLLDIFVSLTGQSESPGGVVGQSEEAVVVATEFFEMIVAGDFLDTVHYESGPVGFGGSHFLSSGLDEDAECGDRPLLRKLCRATFSAMQMLSCDKKPEGAVTNADADECIRILSRYISQKLDLDVTSDLPTWLFKLFADQDDGLVWAMHCCLRLHQAAKRGRPCGHWSGQCPLDPHLIFAGFLAAVSHDPSLLLDWLISSETGFLGYFVQYLHCVLDDWGSFCRSHRVMDSATEYRSPEGSLNEGTSEEEASREGDGTSDPDSDSDEEDRLLLEVDITGDESPATKRRKTLDPGCGPSNQPGSDIHPLCAKGSSPADENQDVLEAKCVDTSDSSERTITPNKYSVEPPQNDSSGSTETTSAKGFDSDNELNEQPSGRFLDAAPSAVSAEESGSQTAMSRSLEDAMTTLIRLRFLVERLSGRNLFPYPARPLLRLLEQVESLYEAMDQG